MNGKYRAFWLNEELDIVVIDQTKLPFVYETVTLRSADDAILAIEDMTIRGAGVIGNIAAFGVYLAARENPTLAHIAQKAEQIRDSRPTAVNLMWAVDIMMQRLSSTTDDLLETALAKAIEISDDDCRQSSLIGKHGCDKLEEIMRQNGKNSIRVLTHCNAGWLAIADDGSALAPIYEAQRRGIDIEVWVDETRPRNQGANLTAWELERSGIKHTIIPDNTGGYLMQQGLVDACIVGADRVSTQGDVANKIGTYLKALAAHDNAIPFYVAIPDGTLDWDILDGVRDTPIEMRSTDEVRYMRGLNSSGEVEKLLVLPEGSQSVNYGFDITPNRLITGLITKNGICKANKYAIEKFISRP